MVQCGEMANELDIKGGDGIIISLANDPDFLSHLLTCQSDAVCSWRRSRRTLLMTGVS